MIRAELFSDKWPQVRLGDVVEFLDHKRKPITAKDRIPGPYPYYGANGQQDSVDGYIFDEPLVLVAEDGGYFGDPNRTIAYQVEGKCWVNNHAHVLRPTSKIDIRYLCRHLEKYDVRPYINGATREKLNKGTAQELIISLPPLEEQKRIAKILDKADAIRRKRQQAISLTDQLLRSVFLDIFGDPVTNPKGWEKLRLEDVVNKVIDCPHSTPKWKELGKIAIRTSNLTAGGWNWEDTRYVSDEEFHDRSKRAYVKPGDVVLSREGTVGIAAIVEENMEICLGQRLVQLVPDSSTVISEYLLHILLYELEPERIERVMVGATSKHINVKELRTMNIPVPPMETQEKFKDVIDQICALRLKFNIHFDKHNDLFNSLTQKAFSGALSKQVKAA